MSLRPYAIHTNWIPFITLHMSISTSQATRPSTTFLQAACFAHNFFYFFLKTKDTFFRSVALSYTLELRNVSELILRHGQAFYSLNLPTIRASLKLALFSLFSCESENTSISFSVLLIQGNPIELPLPENQN